VDRRLRLHASYAGLGSVDTRVGLPAMKRDPPLHASVRGMDIGSSCLEGTVEGEATMLTRVKIDSLERFDGRANPTYQPEAKSIPESNLPA
jgi:hypothetical protein